MVDTTDIKEVVVTPETPLDPSPKRVEGHEIGETVSADLGSVAGTLHKPPLKIETEDKGQSTAEELVKSAEERPQVFKNVVLDTLKAKGFIQIKDKNALVDRFGNPVIPQSGGEDGAEVNIIKFSNVLLDSDGKATLTPTAEQWNIMANDAEECIVVIQLQNGVKFVLSRVHIDTSRIIFASQHSTTETLEDATATFIHVDGDGYYSGGIVVDTMLEANGVLDEQTEYAELHNITVNGETYVMPEAGGKLYNHLIALEVSGVGLVRLSFLLQTPSAELIDTVAKLAKILYDMNATDTNHSIPVGDHYAVNGSNIYLYSKIYAQTESQVGVYERVITGSIADNTISFTLGSGITRYPSAVSDIVTEA